MKLICLFDRLCVSYILWAGKWQVSFANSKMWFAERLFVVDMGLIDNFKEIQ